MHQHAKLQDNREMLVGVVYD